MDKNTTLYKRRAQKLISLFVSQFTASYVFNWKEYFGEKKLKYTPVFDARVVCYPNEKVMRDYLSWRQVDCHINNLYNTCFWALVQSGISKTEAEKELSKTDSGQKNELLFQKFNINYNQLAEIYKKGTTIYKKQVFEEHFDQHKNTSVKKKVISIASENIDIISEKFWKENSNLIK